MFNKYIFIKIISIACIIYSIYTGFLGQVVMLPILRESIRNLYFHVPMWFAMIFSFLISIIYSGLYLAKNNYKYDAIAKEAVITGIYFGIAGLITGMLWARYTWGSFWSSDPKQNCALIALILYFAYLLLRNSIALTKSRATLSAVYNIFAFPMMVILLFILPRISDSLHPGNGGNPAFNTYDLNKHMRVVFYPAVLGWILMSGWIINIRYRISRINQYLNENT
ncbi:MAG: cytochrome c biogenesis protein CcsA [Solitalea-like symbiont of Acarus siro]